MRQFTCTNCTNFKTRIVTGGNLGKLPKAKVRSAIRNHDLESLALSFPLNFSAYKKVKRDGECKILFCSQDMLKRDLYIDRDNAGSIRPEIRPCPRYA